MKGIFGFLRKIIRPLAFIIGIGLIAMLGMMLVAGVVVLVIGIPVASFIYPNSPFTITLAVLNIFFIIGIPATMLILAIMRVFMRSNFKPKWQFGLWAFWFLNVVGAFAIGSYTASQLSHSSQPQIIGSEPLYLGSDTLFVEMEPSPAQDALIRFGPNTCISGNQLFNGNIDLNFRRSTSEQFEVEQLNSSRGKSIAEAETLANKVLYNYRIEGNRLILPSYFVIPKGEKCRFQKVILNVYVPDGKFVNRGSRTVHFTHHVEHDHNERFSYWRNDEIWQMTPKGMVAPETVERARKQFSFRDFSKIRTEGDIKLEIRKGNDFKIQVTEGERRLDHLEISQNNGRLDLRSDGHRFTLEITMPELEQLWLISSRDVDIRDFNSEKLRIVNESRGDIDIFADIDSLNVELTGQNELDIRGNGTFLKGFVSGNARLQAEHFDVRNADIEIKPQGRAYLAVSDTLRKKVDGDRLKLRGNPVIIDLNAVDTEEEEQSDEEEQ